MMGGGVAYYFIVMNYTYKKIWLINFPVMMSVLVEQLINITDAVFLGRVGETELGASAIAAIYYLALYMLGFGFSLGLQVVIARRNGEQAYKSTGRAFFQGLWFLLGMAFLILLLSRLASPGLMKFLVSSPDVYEAVIGYLHWRGYGLLFIFPALAFRAFFVGTTKTSMLTANALIMVCSNIFLNWVLIFGKLGFPAFGIEGAAMASSISEGISLLLFLGYAVFRLKKQAYGFKAVFDGKIMVQIIKISLWSMMHAFMSVAPWLLFFISIEHLGKSQLAVANIIRSISSVFFIMVSSFGSTTASLVSNLIGAGQSKDVHILCLRVITLGYVVGLPLIMLALMFYIPVISIYTSEQNLIDIGFTPYVVMLLNYLLALPSHVMLNAVTGTGATRAAFMFQVITIFFYLIYIFILNSLPGIPLAVYWTIEYLFVILLFIMSAIYMTKWYKRNKTA